jgi:hypothetical protein
MNKFKITFGNTTIEFASLAEAQSYVAENNLNCEIVEFFDETISLDRGE